MARTLVHRNLTSKDRAIRKPGDHAKGTEKSQELSKPAEIKALSMDRPDLQNSAKEISSDMSERTRVDRGKSQENGKVSERTHEPKCKTTIQVRSVGAYPDGAPRIRLGMMRIKSLSSSGGVASTNVGLLKHWSLTQRLVRHEQWMRRSMVFRNLEE